MQAAAAAPAPPPPPRRRVYTALDPRCEWTSTAEADTLVVDVSGFSKEELKVLYNTRRKIKVTGERQVEGAQWARFLKVFPVPRSCDENAIQAKMNTESARLFVILPKGSTLTPPPPSKDKHKEHQPERTQTLGELIRRDGSSGSSSGSMWSAQEDPGKGKVEDEERRDQAVEEPRQDQQMAIQDLPRGEGGANGNANAAENNDGDGKGQEDKRWWKKIRVLHVLGFVLVLALVGVGATLLYIVLL
ncbi:unnamed protein product [Urochloa decumbens]|uniref:SHSP domain-containing protein n=1 Tax=Urochloa decumbens TaxID=240449 RepID=A0ABC8XK44_9POAL